MQTSRNMPHKRKLSLDAQIPQYRVELCVEVLGHVDGDFRHVGGGAAEDAPQQAVVTQPQREAVLRAGDQKVLREEVDARPGHRCIICVE